MYEHSFNDTMLENYTLMIQSIGVPNSAYRGLNTGLILIYFIHKDAHGKL